MAGGGRVTYLTTAGVNDGSYTISVRRYEGRIVQLRLKENIASAFDEDDSDEEAGFL